MTAGPRRGGHTRRRPPRQSSCPQAGLVFRPSSISTIAAGAAENTPENSFSPTLRGGFCTPRAGSSFTTSTDAVPAETAYEDRPLTSSASLLRPFSVSVCSKQTEVCGFHFLFAENKRKLPFSVSSVFLLHISVNMEMETWKHGEMETWT
jgi:hypothetical protein